METSIRVPAMVVSVVTTSTRRGFRLLQDDSGLQICTRRRFVAVFRDLPFEMMNLVGCHSISSFRLYLLYTFWILRFIT